MIRRLVLTLLVLTLAGAIAVTAQSRSILEEDWVSGTISFTLVFKVDTFTPQERSRTYGEAERVKTEAFLKASRELQLNSSTRLSQWIQENPRRLPALETSIDQIPLSGSRYDREFGSIEFRYMIPLFPDMAQPLIDHRDGYDLPPTLFFRPSAPYSGILIYAAGEYPVHGENRSAALEPALFPRIWDEEMNLLFEPEMMDRSLLLEAGPVGYARALDNELIRKRVGPNPARILTRRLFGVTPTDPVIPREDALSILNSAQGRRLLREGRIIIVY